MVTQQISGLFPVRRPDDLRNFKNQPNVGDVWLKNLLKVFEVLQVSNLPRLPVEVHVALG